MGTQRTDHRRFVGATLMGTAQDEDPLARHLMIRRRFLFGTVYTLRLPTLHILAEG